MICHHGHGKLDHGYGKLEFWGKKTLMDQSAELTLKTFSHIFLH